MLTVDALFPLQINSTDVNTYWEKHYFIILMGADRQEPFSNLNENKVVVASFDILFLGLTMPMFEWPNEWLTLMLNKPSF